MRGRGIGEESGSRRPAALAGALAVTLGMLLWGAAPAAAGGPTSAFLASPETGETAGLYYSDREYGRLDSLLAAGRPALPPEDVTADRHITVTWLIHDTSPWKVDRIFPATEGEDIWVYRSADTTEPARGDWQRVPDPGPLRTLLTEVGMLGEPDTGEDLTAFPLRETYPAGGVAEDPAEPAADEPTATEAPVTGASVTGGAEASGSGSGGGTGWWWALPGAAVGGVLALVLRPFAARLPLGAGAIRGAAARPGGGPPREEPRGRLIDL
ncbi:hypothetical protein [Streptomyces sp. NPDC000983]|uniref:hypothetical protein n=1 Tax=Streptomyces sp. NPDC000983 TaxID=3154373 RepID=UPI0033259FEF